MNWTLALPVMAISGMESACAVYRPVTKFVAAGSGGANGQGQLARGAEIAVGGVHRALFVARDVMPDA